MSSTTTTNIDYINTNFAYPTLTKITGIPTYAQLKAIKDELKTNAGTIQCDLGGGQNGHLGLLLTNNEYATISATPYICPIHPGPVIPVGTTNYGSQVLHDNHHNKFASSEKQMVSKKPSSNNYIRCFQSYTFVLTGTPTQIE